MKLLDLPYPSRRVPAVARRGMVATSQPLAVRAGLAMLEAGGSAADAAVAAAAMLTVVEPPSNGIGGDAFALVWDGEQLHGLNGSGRAPAALTPELVQASGHSEMPSHGWLTVTVPGAPRAWHDLHQRFGRLDFEAVLEPAIATASQGYAVTPVVAYYWNLAARVFASYGGAEFAGWLETFMPGGRAPDAGEVWRSQEMADTLRRIAESGSEDFYQGELARRMATFAEQTGGYLAREDLAAHSGNWVEPIHTTYRGYEVWEIPPNAQGLPALIALNILEPLELSQLPRESVEAYHLQIEAMKLAFADAQRYIADPERVAVPTGALLSKAYAAERRTLIGDRALDPTPGSPRPGGTVYLCAADADGMMISFIQSNYQGFGSGIVVPDTGIALHNRGAGFTLEEGHPNRLDPGKRPFHTIIPGFLTREGQAVGPFGVMGGHMQPQGHVQMIVNTLDYGLNPQASLDAPRWYWSEGREITLEPGLPDGLVRRLRDQGHQVTIAGERGIFGRGQIIWRLPSGAFVAGSDDRADGYAVGF